MTDEQLLESLMRQVGAIYRSGGDPDLGASVAAQMHEVCDRLPVLVADEALARYFLRAMGSHQSDPKGLH